MSYPELENIFRLNLLTHDNREILTCPASEIRYYSGCSKTCTLSLTIFAGVSPSRGFQASCTQWAEVMNEPIRRQCLLLISQSEGSISSWSANHSPVMSQVTGCSSGQRGEICCCSWVTRPRGQWPTPWPSAAMADTSSGQLQESWHVICDQLLIQDEQSWTNVMIFQWLVRLQCPPAHPRNGKTSRGGKNAMNLKKKNLMLAMIPFILLRSAVQPLVIEEWPQWG